MTDLNVEIIEQPGSVGRTTAAQLGRMIAKLLEIPEFRVEVERRIQESEQPRKAVP